jgi:hypothetical protein
VLWVGKIEVWEPNGGSEGGWGCLWPFISEGVWGRLTRSVWHGGAHEEALIGYERRWRR